MLLASSSPSVDCQRDGQASLQRPLRAQLGPRPDHKGRVASAVLLSLAGSLTGCLPGLWPDPDAARPAFLRTAEPMMTMPGPASASSLPLVNRPVDKTASQRPHEPLYLSPQRKLLAGTLGSLAVVTLVGSALLVAEDGQATTSASCSYMGMMTSPDRCVLDTRAAYGVGFGLTAALLGGLALTLWLPTSTSKPAARPSTNTAPAAAASVPTAVESTPAVMPPPPPAPAPENSAPAAPATTAVSPGGTP